MPPNGSGGSPSLAIDQATGLPVELVSNISAGAPAGTTDDPLPALGSVPAPSGLVAEVQLPVAPAALASAGDVTRDDRDRSQPFRTAFDVDVAPAAAVAAPAAGAEASPGAVTASRTPAPELTSPGGVSDQVAAHLVRMVSSASRDMVMRLRPPELGDVTVRIAVTGRDVSAWFASPQPQVQSVISAAIGQLQTSLGDAGYNLSGAWVGGGATNAQQERPSPPTPAASRVSSTAAAIPSGAAAQLPAASGLNIYV
jgi:flagellar hook-length control protein FliK